MWPLRQDKDAVRRLEPRSTRRCWPIAAAAAWLLLFTLVVAGCGQSEPPNSAEPAASASAPEPAPEATRREPPPRPSAPIHDLSTDEASGGHTLARHVGKTDDELRARLRREPDISSASTYTDRTTAEGVVGAALAAPPRAFDAWRNRQGSRPNFVIHFGAYRVIGRSVGRRSTEAVPCEDALVVIRWDVRRDRFFVLTSYPEARH